MHLQSIVKLFVAISLINLVGSTVVWSEVPSIRSGIFEFRQDKSPLLWPSPLVQIYPLPPPTTPPHTTQLSQVPITN